MAYSSMKCQSESRPDGTGKIFTTFGRDVSDAGAACGLPSRAGRRAQPLRHPRRAFSSVVLLSFPGYWKTCISWPGDYNMALLDELLKEPALKSMSALLDSYV